MWIAALPTAGVGDTLQALPGRVLALWQNQLGGMFLAPGSTFSLAALACSLALFVILATRHRRRPLRAAVLLRALFPRRLWRSASGRADMAYFAFGVLVAGFAVGWAVVSAEMVRQAGEVLLHRLFGPPVPLPLPGWLASVAVTVALFLAYEFAYWLDHCLSHKIPLLWHFHKVHHQAESLSLLTNGRVHPVDTVVFYNIVAVILGLAGAVLHQLVGPATPLAFGGTNLLILLSSVALTHLQHSHLWLGFGPRGSRWLLGPAHHQIHHSRDEAHFDRNFGNATTVFDRLFGTFLLPDERPADLRFGVEDEERHPHGLRACLVQPFVGAARDIRRGLRVRLRARLPLLRFR